MHRIVKKSLIVISLIILHGNLWSIFYKVFTSDIFPVYRFTTEDCGFSYRLYPWKGGKISDMIEGYHLYLDEHNLDLKTPLYRTFKRNPFKFWMWREYYSKDVYVNYAYKEPCDKK